MTAEAGGSDQTVPLPKARRIMLENRFRFVLEKCMGTGAFGSVHRAAVYAIDGGPEPPARLAAVKLYKSPGDLDPVELMKRELAALRTFNMETIPAVYDWSIEKPTPFIAMQYYGRGSLKDAFSVMGRLDEREAWRLLIDVLRPLRAAHQQGFLHLDIKPGNILLRDEGGYALADFGISQAMLAHEEEALTCGLGSRGYQAPEQAAMRIDRFDARTDLFSLGATLWSALTGLDLSRHARFYGSHDEVDYYPPLELVRPEVSPILASLIQQLTKVRHEQRPGGAAELLSSIEQESSRLDLTGSTFVRMRDERITEEDLQRLREATIDPLWSAILRGPQLVRHITRFDEGEFLCHEGDKSYFAFVLLTGEVEVLVDDQLVHVETREGTFLGEIATLTGTERTATLRARKPVIGCVFNAAELEEFLSFHPALSNRLLKLVCERVLRDRDFHSASR